MARFVGRGAGKRTLFIAKQFGFDKRFGNSSTVDFYNGFVATAGVLVNQVCDQPLTNSRFTEDQNRRVDFTDFQRLLERLDHTRTFGNHRLTGEKLFLKFLYLVTKMITNRLLFFQLPLETISFSNIAFANHHANQFAGIIKHRGCRRNKFSTKTVFLQQTDHAAGLDGFKGCRGKDNQPFFGNVEIGTSDQLFSSGVVDSLRSWINTQDKSCTIADKKAI